MGPSAGRKGLSAFNPFKHRKRHFLKTLAIKGLTGKQLFKEMNKHVNCDGLVDNPTKRNAARYILWIAYINRIEPADMAWVKPFIHYAKVNEWNAEKHIYGSAAAYGRDC